MSILYLTLGVSFLIALGFLFLFLWAARGGQYEDDETPAIRMLFDDDSTQSSQNKINS